MAAPVARSVTTRLEIDARGWVAGGQLAQRSMRETSRVAQQGARDAIRAFREQQVAQERAAAAAERASQRAAREQSRAANQAARDAERAARQQEQATKRAAAEAERAAAKQSAAYDRVGTAVGAAGLAITAGLGMAIGKSMDFEASMSGAAAATGLSGKALDALRDTAVRAGASTQYSATEAADAITEMAKAGISASDIMGGGLTGALNLAAAGQLGVADAAEIAASMLTQFKLQGSDLPHVADLLSAAAGKAQGSVQDMGLAMTYVGPVAAGLGVSIEETSGAVAELASNGIIGEKAGTGLRGMLMALSAPSQKAAETMDDLGIKLYDANGHFIGVRGAAEELHRTLGPLDEATRNAALGQIFGNEQIVAARVFYEGGGRAVDQWTAKVNDSGFAAEQAAKLTDNLRGDIERLGGAFDTALIGSGSSANGVLRETVQLGTGALDIYNSLPHAVQVAGTAFGAAAGGVGLLSGGLLLAAPRIKATREALNDMGRVGTVLQRGLSGTAGILGGPWGIALAAGTTALGIWAQKHADAVKWQQDLRGTLDQTTGALTDQTTAMVAARLQQDDTFKLFGRLAGGVDVLTQAAMGNAGALETLRSRQAADRAEMDALISSHERLTPQQQAQLEALGSSQEAWGELNKRLGNVRGELGEQIGKQKELAAATGQGADQAKTASGATRGLATAQNRQATAAENAQQQIDDLTNALRAIYDANFGAEEAADAFRSALNHLDDSAAKGTRSIKGNSDAALTNREALRRVAQAALNATEKYAEQGHTTDDVRKRAERYRGELIRSARQAGFSQRAAEHYADALLQVPKDVKTNVTTPGMESAEQRTKRLKAALDEIRKLPKIDVAIAVGVSNKLAASGSNRNGPNGVGDGYGDVSSPPVRRQTGGQVHGPGGPRDDVIPALLSNREWVHPVAAVDLYGPRFMRDVQTGRFPVELAQAYADGGQVAIRGATSGIGSALSPLAAAVRRAVADVGSVTGDVGGAAGAGVGMGYQRQMAILRAQFPGITLNSGFRPGAITATGHRSYHSMGRAVDIPPRMEYFNWIRANYGRSTKELIFSPAGNAQLWHGRPHYYTGVTRRMHFNHVHWAMNRGGQVGSQDRFSPAASYSGGWAQARGYAAGGPVLGADYSGISTIVQSRVTVSGDDLTRQRADLRQAQKDLTAATKALAGARAKDAKAEDDARGAVRSARANLRAAETAADRRGMNAQQRAAARARVTAATERLEAAERKLAAVQKDPNAHRARDTIVRQRENLAKATKTLHDTEVAYRAQSRPLSVRFHEAATSRNRVTAGFLRNLQTLAARGFGDLARQLTEMGGADAETLAAQAVASTRVARTLQADLTTSARLQAQEASLPARLAITSALRTQRNPTIAGLAASTGIAASDLQAAALAMRGSLGRNTNARALLSGVGTNTTAGGFAPAGSGGDTIVVQVASTANPWLDGERAMAGAKRVKSVGSSRRF